MKSAVPILALAILLASSLARAQEARLHDDILVTESVLKIFGTAGGKGKVLPALEAALTQLRDEKKDLDGATPALRQLVGALSEGFDAAEVIHTLRSVQTIEDKRTDDWKYGSITWRFEVATKIGALRKTLLEKEPDTAAACFRAGFLLGMIDNDVIGPFFQPAPGEGTFAADARLTADQTKQLVAICEEYRARCATDSKIMAAFQPQWWRILKLPEGKLPEGQINTFVADARKYLPALKAQDARCRLMQYVWLTLNIARERNDDDSIEAIETVFHEWATAYKGLPEATYARQALEITAPALKPLPDNP